MKFSRIILVTAFVFAHNCNALGQKPFPGPGLSANGPEAVAGPVWERELRAHLDALGRNDLDMIDALPDVLPRTLSSTRYSFRGAGWSVARRTFYDIVRSQLRSWADDDSIAACDVAWDELYKTLRAIPGQCRSAVTTGWDAVTTPFAVEAVNRVKTICEASTENGFRNRRARHAWPIITDKNWLTFLKAAFDQPEPLSQAERDAIDAAGKADPATVCEAKLKLGRNFTAEGMARLGAFHRASYRFDERNDEVAAATTSTRHWPRAPDDFVCAAPGTKFVLSNHGWDGKPVIHTVLGRAEYDCLIASSISGERGLLLRLDPENPARPANNWLRSLWPLAVGKTARYSYHPAFGDQREEQDSVTDYRSVPFNGAQVQAFEITQNISMNDGELIYRYVDYWAPSIGYLVGHRTTAFRGSIRQPGAPDWYVVRMYRPRAGTKL